MFLAAITLAFIGFRSISAVAEQRLSVECVSEYSWVSDGARIAIATISLMPHASGIKQPPAKSM
jgi:hypothetical protein